MTIKTSSVSSPLSAASSIFYKKKKRSIGNIEYSCSTSDPSKKLIIENKHTHKTTNNQKEKRVIPSGIKIFPL
jgi:hypothetical protein